MFCLSEIEHTLRILPSLLDRPLEDAIKGELESLFVDKVIAKLGLCISIYDIKQIDGGFIFSGHGAPTYTVKFRMVMFRPFVGEVIGAQLKESNASGIRLSVGFFDDIYVPAHKMLENTNWIEDPQDPGYLSWVWTFDSESNSTYPIDGSDEIRFRVENIHYPSIPVVEDSNDSNLIEDNPENIEKERKEPKKPFAPMVITGSIAIDGLGHVSWW